MCNLGLHAKIHVDWEAKGVGLCQFCAVLDSDRHWTKQMVIGAMYGHTELRVKRAKR